MLVRWLLVFIKENSSRTSIPPAEMINYNPSYVWFAHNLTEACKEILTVIINGEAWAGQLKLQDKSRQSAGTRKELNNVRINFFILSINLRFFLK